MSVSGIIIISGSLISVNMFYGVLFFLQSVAWYHCEAVDIVKNKAAKLVYRRKSGFILLHLCAEN